MNKDDLLLRMSRIRAIERAIANKYHEQKMRCPVHLSIGQEGPAVGVCAALAPNDKMVSTHRGHAHYLAKGGSLTGLIGELYGKSIGCSRGNGGSMHLIDLKANFWGSTSIVAQTIPYGVGLSFSDRLKGLTNYTAVCFGDAAVEEGVFHEAANFAGLHSLNVIFVCENNFYSCFTRIDQRQPTRSFINIAHSHGLKYYRAEPGSVMSVYKKAVSARMSRGPSFLEIPTYRYVEHCGPSPDDNLNYRPEKERELWGGLDECPTTNNFDREIERAFDEVEASAPPAPNEFGAYEYAK